MPDAIAFPTSVLRLPGVIARTGLSRSTIYALLARGDFVRPLKLTARAIGFLAVEVDEWVNDRAARRARSSQPPIG